MTKTDNQAEVGRHVFERSGLGKAPFRCVGMTEKVYQACDDAPVQPGGSCDYCGTGIRYVCIIRSADGKQFEVGTDCVAKTGDKGLIKSYKQRPEVRAKQRAARQRADERVCAKWQALMADDAVVKKLSALTVERWNGPISYFEDVKRLWGMCGASGRARTLRSVTKLIAKLEG